MLKLICAVSGEPIDRNVVRTNGRLTTTGLLAYVFTGSPLLIVPIGLDYVMRASMTAPTSAMTHLSRAVARGLRVLALPLLRAREAATDAARAVMAGETLPDPNPASTQGPG